MYRCKVIADSVNSVGQRLTTMELEYPRIIHAEMMTHRVFSRNAQSSRAIPVEKSIQKVRDDPFIPAHFGQNQRGMQAPNVLENEELIAAKLAWLLAASHAASSAKQLSELKLHKQLANRVLEPYSWITVIISSTEWSNFLSLRQDYDIPIDTYNIQEMFNPEFPAQPEMQVIAFMMRQALNANRPFSLEDGKWHLPYVNDEEVSFLITCGTERGILNYVQGVSVARCARVSYLTHDGYRSHEADYGLYRQLYTNHHASPLEHVAQAAPDLRSRNFYGFYQYRDMIGI